MGLTSIPTETDGSLGRDKADLAAVPNLDNHISAAEYNVLKKAVAEMAASVGLGDGSTANSLMEFMLYAPYLTGAFIAGKPTASVVHLHVFAIEVVFPAGLTGSKGKALVAATAQADFDIKKNGVSVGTMRFAASGTVPTFIFASQTTFAVGDYMTVDPPATPDATLENITFSLKGTR